MIDVASRYVVGLAVVTYFQHMVEIFDAVIVHI